MTSHPANIYLHQVSSRNTRKMCEICSKLTKTHNWRHSNVFIVNFEHISHLMFYCFCRWVETDKYMVCRFGTHLLRCFLPLLSILCDIFSANIKICLHFISANKKMFATYFVLTLRIVWTVFFCWHQQFFAMCFLLARRFVCTIFSASIKKCLYYYTFCQHQELVELYILPTLTITWTLLSTFPQFLCSLESQNKILCFIHNVHQASGYLICHISSMYKPWSNLRMH